MNDIAHVPPPNRTRSLHSLSVIAAVLWGCLLLALSLPAFAQAPVVSNVVAQQRPGTGLVDITYDLTATTATVAISLRVSSDAGATFAVPVTTLSGAIGTGVTVGVGKRITWNAGADWPEKWSDVMRFEISADDGVITAPVITTQPSSLSLNPGSTATLSVTATGSIPLSYQWYEGDVGTTTNPVGANAATFTTSPLTKSTRYWVRVSNIGGTVNSNLAQLSVSTEMVLIPLGSVTLGSVGGDTDENSVPVTLDSSEFYIARCEVTKALWDNVRIWAIVNGYSDLSNGAGKGANHPVQTVTWWDAVKWCNARSEKEGLTPVYRNEDQSIYRTGTGVPISLWGANGYRLPTETEWEKAARGGISDKRFPWGSDSISHARANYYGSSTTPYDQSPINAYHPTYNNGQPPFTSPIGSFPANGYGLFDQAGNVSEWCWDWYQSSYSQASLVDPRGPTTGTRRVNRGGAWDGFANTTRCSARGSELPAALSDNVGFRLARSSAFPLITKDLTSISIDSGSSATISVQVNSPTTLKYQWYLGDVGNTTAPVGTNSSSFTSPVLTNTANYWVRITNAAGLIDSALATISVRPRITIQPISQTIVAGSTVTLTVVADGSDQINYQWYLGSAGDTSTPVGSNSESFTTPALTETKTYWVRVSNSVGTVDSFPVIVSCSPLITLQPLSQTIVSGSSTTLTVTASGSTPLTYQWYQGAVGTTTTPVGTNSASFTTPMLTNTTNYWARVSNSVGSVNSSLASMSCSPAITTQPATQTIVSGSTATLTVTASGSTPLTYQWYQGAVGTTTTPVGTNTASFTTPTLTDTTTYWVRVSNSVGSVNSSLASISCSPTITTQPAARTIISGTTTTLSVTANGSTPLAYQWYQGPAGTTTTPVGTNSASFTTPALSADTSYWVQVSNTTGSVNSTLAKVKVLPEMILIPAGAFQMGVTSGDTDSDAPSVSVTVSPFYIGTFEVTKAQWDEVWTWANANGYSDLYTTEGHGRAPNHPVYTVSWWSVIKWCNARSQKEGLTPCYTVSGAVMKTGTAEPAVNWSANGYRLPTEAEWEKAARGGVSAKRFPWGTDTISHTEANFTNNGSEPYQLGTTSYYPTYDKTMPFTLPVGSFAANGYGLYDMAGNVWEWCWDRYGSSTYLNGAKDPRGDASGTYRVYRGGSWYVNATNCRAAYRGRNNPSDKYFINSVGFRVARSSAQ
jgi:formylglycine-generating enzyme required for sulfatase activity